MRCRISSLASAAMLASMGQGLAHHSHAMYDASGEIELQGTVSEVRWRNPHVWMYLDVVANGETRTWAFEGAAIAQLERKGWAQDSMKPGDEVHISCYPLRNGGPGCLGGYVLSINGEELPATHENHVGREWD